MPYDTLEARWFFDGAVGARAPALAAWLAGCGPPGSEGAESLVAWPALWRTDRYILVPGAEDMGLKEREGRFEIKGRVGTFGVCAFTGAAEGVLERWLKWSYALPETGAAAAGGIPERRAFAVLPVAKRRIVRPLPLAAGRLASGPATGTGGASVACELARIRLGGSRTETHWSLAFEAFPYAPDLRAPFVRAVGALLRSWPLGPLAAERSMSYPAWLASAGSAPPR